MFLIFVIEVHAGSVEIKLSFSSTSVSLASAFAAVSVRFDLRGVQLCSGSRSRRGMHCREGREDHGVLPDDEADDERLCFSSDLED